MTTTDERWESREREGYYARAAAGIYFTGDIACRGGDARLGANDGARSRAGQQRARGVVHSGFLRRMDSPILAWLRPATNGSWPDNEQVAPARRCRQQQSIGGRLHQSDPEAPGRGSREEVQPNLVSRRHLSNSGQPVLASAR